MHCHDVTLIWSLTFAIVNLTFKILSGLYSETRRCSKLILDRDRDIGFGIWLCIVMMSP